MVQVKELEPIEEEVVVRQLVKQEEGEDEWR